MSVQSIELTLSEEAYESNQDSVGTSDDDIKMTPVETRTFDQLFEGRKPSSSECMAPPRSKEPIIYDDATEIVPSITVVPPLSTKDNTKNVKVPPKKAKSPSRPNPSQPTRQIPPPNQVFHPSPPHHRLASK